MGAFGKPSWCYGGDWMSQMYGSREFCVDMGAFAFDASLLQGLASPVWNYTGRPRNRLTLSAKEQQRLAKGTLEPDRLWTSRGGETEFIRRIGIRFPEQLQPLANCALDVLVNHNGFATPGVDDVKHYIPEASPWIGVIQPRHPMCKEDGW